MFHEKNYNFFFQFLFDTSVGRSINYCGPWLVVTTDLIGCRLQNAGTEAP